MSHLIAIVNHKGGVGKTTLAVNLAHTLAVKGKRILVVDVDSQCNSTGFFLQPGTPGSTLYELYQNGTPVERCIYPTQYEGVSILPNVEHASFIELKNLLPNNPQLNLFDTPTTMDGDEKNPLLLRKRLRDHALKNFDITLLDCPPNFGLFTLQAMCASDFVIVPIESGSRLSLEGLSHTVNCIEDMRQTLNPDLRFLRLVVNKVDKRTAISKITIEQVKAWYGGKVFGTAISNATAIKQAELVRKTVTRYAPKSTGAVQFRALAKELLDTLET